MNTHLLSDIQAIVLTATGVAGVIIAGLGLKTWRQQLHGTADFETGRAILRGLYNVRDAIHNARRPGQTEVEGDPQPGDDPTVVAYETRWNFVQSARSDLAVALLEGEVSWGDELKVLETELSQHITKLYLAIKHYIASRTNTNAQDLFDRQRDGALIWGNDDDEYYQKLDEIIRSFEQVLKPHLKK
jgi:hypothetical protein